MMAIHLVGKLFTGQLDFFGINNDDMISGIKKWCIDGLILTGKNSSGSCGQPTKDLPLSIDYVPTFLDIAFTGDKTLHHGLPQLTTKQNNPLGYPSEMNVSRGIAASLILILDENAALCGSFDIP